MSRVGRMVRSIRTWVDWDLWYDYLVVGTYVTIVVAWGTFLVLVWTGVIK